MPKRRLSPKTPRANLLLGAGVLLVSLAFLLNAPVELARATIESEVLSLQLRPVARAVDDGIPDEWQAANWGSSRAVHSLQNGPAQSGAHAASIVKTSGGDYSVFEQQLDRLQPGRLTCRLYSKGATGFVQLRDPSGAVVAHAELAASEQWRQASLEVQISVAQPHTLTLGIGPQAAAIEFDEVDCHVTGRTESLVRNGGFDIDGRSPSTSLGSEWQSLVVQPAAPETLRRALGVLVARGSGVTSDARHAAAARLMLNLAPEPARDPASGGCAAAPVFIVTLGRTRPATGPDAGMLNARARLIMAALQNSPDCHLFHAALADYYASRGAFARAADHYLEAARLGSDERANWRYMVQAARLDSDVLGNWRRAADVLALLPDDALWVADGSERGARDVMRGIALMQLGDCAAARMHIRAVLACESCSFQHQRAAEALQSPCE
jgi:hypothetical protein